MTDCWGIHHLHHTPRQLDTEAAAASADVGGSEVGAVVVDDGGERLRRPAVVVVACYGWEEGGTWRAEVHMHSLAAAADIAVGGKWGQQWHHR